MGIASAISFAAQQSVKQCSMGTLNLPRETECKECTLESISNVYTEIWWLVRQIDTNVGMGASVMRISDCHPTVQGCCFAGVLAILQATGTITCDVHQLFFLCLARSVHILGAWA